MFRNVEKDHQEGTNTANNGMSSYVSTLERTSCDLKGKERQRAELTVLGSRIRPRQKDTGLTASSHPRRQIRQAQNITQNIILQQQRSDRVSTRVVQIGTIAAF